MPELILFALIGGGLSVALALRVYRQRDSMRTWRRAAARCGLTDIADQPAGLVGAWSGNLHVRLGAYRRREDDEGTRIHITDLDRRLSGITLRPESIGTSVQKHLFGAREIEVGDADFDAAFYVGGVSSIVQARLDALTRRRLMVLVQSNRLEIVGGELRVDLAESPRVRAEHVLPMLLKATLDVAGRLTRPLDVLPALADNARADPNPTVRLNNVLALAREFANQAEGQAALREACTDPSAPVRLRAALALGRAGRETLLALTESDADDACVARAVLALREELPADRIKEVLGRALRGRCFDTAGACLRVLGWHGGDEVVPTLAKVMRIEAANELGVAAAAALGAAQQASAEASLITALQQESAALRVAAADALGNVGTVAAVLPLQEAEAVWRDVDLARAARQAIAQIQARLRGASPGLLSLSEAEAGQLSVADREAGQVSFANGESGQLSIPDGARGQISLGQKPDKR